MLGNLLLLLLLLLFLLLLLLLLPGILSFDPPISKEVHLCL